MPPTRIVFQVAIVCLSVGLVVGDACLQQENASCLNGNHEHPMKLEAQNECFRAAVFENNRNETSLGHQRYQDNLSLYARAAKIAAENGAKLIVFPEQGLGDAIVKRGDEYEEIPDPEKLTSDNNNPCAQTEHFQGNFDILRGLSCMAKENKLYVVANYATKQSCRPGERVGQHECPLTGHFKLNTNVVLDPRGTFIKRYRKFNLFFTEWLKGYFNHSPSLEEIYFDTPFGRFGLFTCFDMGFKWPAVNLVEKHKIDTVVFPTFWHDEAPIFSGLIAQDSWSRSYQVNLLAANLLKHELGSAGSGIYSGNNSFFTDLNSKSGRLLIANLASKPRGKKCAQSFDPISIDVDGGHQIQEYHHNNYQLQASDKVVALSRPELADTFCSGKVCCRVDLKVKGSVDEDSLSRLIVIVRDGNRPGPFGLYEQVCLLATLDKPHHRAPLNETTFAREPLVEFAKLSLEATFETRYVLPTAGASLTNLFGRTDNQFECNKDTSGEVGLVKCRHTYLAKRPQKLYSFGLYGRMYGRDKMPPGWTVASD